MKEIAFFPPVILDPGETPESAVENAMYTGQAIVEERPLDIGTHTDVPVRRQGFLNYTYTLKLGREGKFLTIRPITPEDETLAAITEEGEEVHVAEPTTIEFGTNTAKNQRRLIAIASRGSDKTILLYSMLSLS